MVAFDDFLYNLDHLWDEWLIKAELVIDQLLLEDEAIISTMVEGIPLKKYASIKYQSIDLNFS